MATQLKILILWDLQQSQKRESQNALLTFTGFPKNVGPKRGAIANLDVLEWWEHVDLNVRRQRVDPFITLGAALRGGEGGGRRCSHREIIPVTMQ
jgi:hypothetical protein